MPLHYGERWTAFKRLQQEIIKKTTDQSILVWTERRLLEPPQIVSTLAPGPRDFKRFEGTIERCQLFTSPFAMTNNGLEIRTKSSMVQAENIPPMLSNLRRSFGDDIYLLTTNYARRRHLSGEWIPMEIPLSHRGSGVYQRLTHGYLEDILGTLPRLELVEKTIYIRDSLSEVVDQTQPNEGLWIHPKHLAISAETSEAGSSSHASSPDSLTE
ncbi:hypothetical protein LTR37_016138 [Vermiconidia calcicola]|uniref:Uncharacterized protein n=1 Tax=Vermiconidia calcicola TaxID=1690605 RepID=A0ACC3MP36_9PEZI|nr:hypothetical protein LTR37_016138 [Vermiconidia calcicola]